MEVAISSRHLDITPQLEKAIRLKIGQLDRFLDELDSAEVHFDEARNPRISDREMCEVSLSGHGHHLRCKVNAPDPFTAIDLAEAKLVRQIRKLRTKLQQRHHGRGDTIRGKETSSLISTNPDDLSTHPDTPSTHPDDLSTNPDSQTTHPDGQSADPDDLSAEPDNQSNTQSSPSLSSQTSRSDLRVDEI